MFKIHTLRALKDNFIYLIEGPQQQCAVVDPGDAAPVQEYLRTHQLQLTHVLCTHHHWDHVNGVAALKAPIVAASETDRGRVPGCNLGLSESQPLKLWGETVAILETPGHTLGQIAYYFQREKALFTGDTLFSAGCGRLFEGTPEQMFSSLQKIKQLPPETKVFFGHEYTLRNLDFVLSRKPDPQIQTYRDQIAARTAKGEDTTPSTLKDEMKINPFLAAQSVGEFAEWREARNHW